MGCDFYTYYKVCIEYKKEDIVETETEIVEDTHEKHYFWYGEPRDTDFEEMDDYYKRIESTIKMQIDRALQKYRKKDIFKDNKWQCIESAKEYYLNICSENDILESDIIAIWKEGDYHYR